MRFTRFLVYLLVIWPLIWPWAETTTHASPPPQADTLASLPGCNFNAYTDHDDLIIGAVALNLETGAGCMQNLNSVFPMASVGKLFVAGYLYDQVARGRVFFEQELTFSPNYLMNGGQACLDASQVGLRFTLGYLGNTMIQCSDNAATWMLMDYLGWENINAYAQSFGIPNIAEIIPYSRVDQLKLTHLDPRWADVPPALASQFYRRRQAEGLVPAYFPTEPHYSREEIAAANAWYLETYDYNSATPRAMMDYMLQLRNDLTGDDPIRATVARWTFNTMLLTQRVFSTQYMPGTVLVGSKNGYDLGYRAEVNITTTDLDDFTPQTVSVVVVRHRDVATQTPRRFRDVPTSDLLLAIAPRIATLLYPDQDIRRPPALAGDVRIRQAVLNTSARLFPCYQNFLDYDYLNGLQRCWFNIPNTDRFNGDDLVGIGFVLRDLQLQDVRFTLVFTLPDNTVRTYQVQRFFENDTAIAWFEDANIPGTWRLDVYFNLTPVFSQRFVVGAQATP
ncbi:MAG: serine hydrolase [Anaerolineales bacterium]